MKPVPCKAELHRQESFRLGLRSSRPGRGWRSLFHVQLLLLALAFHQNHLAVGREGWLRGWVRRRRRLQVIGLWFLSKCYGCMGEAVIIECCIAPCASLYVSSLTQSGLEKPCYCQETMRKSTEAQILLPDLPPQKPRPEHGSPGRRPVEEAGEGNELSSLHCNHQTWMPYAKLV